MVENLVQAATLVKFCRRNRDVSPMQRSVIRDRYEHLASTADIKQRMTIRERADRLLVARGLFESRARAQAAIAAGLVTADGVVVRKASDEISSAAVIEAAPAHPYVSRGGVKLAAALDHFRLDVTGRVCLDVGASTGGFTEVLLQRGARRVYAVDVGRNQLHQRLHGRSDIVSLEETDIRSLDPSRLAEPPDFAAVDVSFIALKLVLPAVGQILAPQATLLALIKPQFEAARRDIKKGIVRDAAVHAAICDDIGAVLISLGWRVGGVVPSAIRGGDGNREFFIEAERG
jgi:23S rRNA (cytidine1920-2'-O)/16S rRNA (cytidine1409-2'-O)-methyltransferase